MSEKPLISIITPVCDGEEYFAETIKTVFDQTYDNWEWVIVDDGSKDGTLEVINKNAGQKKIRVISLKKNSGAAVARNEGIKKAKGDYFCFLDADDLWNKEKIAKQVEFMKAGGYAFSFTGYEFADSNGRPNGKKVLVPPRITYKQALKNTTIWTSTVMFDMNRLKREDIMMPNVPSEDTATWWKVLKKIDCAYGLNEVLSYYRRGGKTLSSNKLVAIERIWYLYRKQEKLGLLQSFVNFVGYAFNAVRRRM